MHEYIRGAVLSVWLRAGAYESWEQAEQAVPPNQASCKAQFRARMDFLAAAGRLRSPDHMNHEDNNIYAIKATCGLRAYGWHCEYQGRRAFVISHVRMKKKQKLDPADRERAEKEREAFRAEQATAQRTLRSVK